MKPFDGIEVLLWITDPAELDVMLPALLGLGIRLRPAQSAEDFRAAMEQGGADLAFAQITASNREPLQFLASVDASVPVPPTLIICENLDVELYLEAMQNGAYDCIGANLPEKELIRIISAALKNRHNCISAVGGPGR